MGVLQSKDLKSILGKKEMRILMLGLDGAGKTTLLHKLNLGEVVSTVPVSGFRIESVQYKNVTFTAWNVNDKNKLWKHYFKGKQGLIFVVDSNNKDKIEKAKEVLDIILKEEELKYVPLLVFATKKDLPQAMKENEIKNGLLKLDSLGDRERHVQFVNATSGEGLYEGLSWLSKAISANTKVPVVSDGM